MNGRLLLFEIRDGAVLAKIRLAAAQEDVEVRQISPGQYHATIGQLAMLPAVEEKGAAALAEPMMVLCLPQDKLDRMLAALRRAQLPPVCKAVLTATNAAWTPAQLLSELQRERAEFMKMRK